MKILSAEQIRKVDAQTLVYNNITSHELMNMASEAIYQWFLKTHIKSNQTISIFCGVGNNGGDGVCLAGKLHTAGVKAHVYVVEYSTRYSSDFEYYLNKVKQLGVSVSVITSIEQFPALESTSVIIDAIFGTGLNREITGLAGQVINKINQSNKHTVSIDVPSGLMMDKETKFAVMANETTTLQIPKLALFLPDNHKFAGDIYILNFGLSKKAIDESSTNIYFITKQDIKNIIKPLDKFSHKGIQGHSLIIGGSLGKIGSVALASKAALKTGCGLATAYIPKCGTMVLQSSICELMVIEDSGEKEITDIIFDIKPNAIGIGVGIGTSDNITNALTRFLETNNTPLVIDADAINIISHNKELLNHLPKHTILTPHPKELSRLIGAWDNDFEKIDKTIALAKEHNIIVIIKGAHTTIISPNEVYVNSSGSPALATAGSGDVLTGIITSLLAQGYPALQAAQIGVYLHGLTANITSQNIHPFSFVASDIINNIGSAYFTINSDEEICDLKKDNYYND